MIDHFVLGVADLDLGMRFLADATGVEPIPGGRHTQLGTHNALVSLGERQYLEILAPDPTQDVLVGALAVLPELKEPRLIKWAAVTRDVEHALERLEVHGYRGHAVEGGSRTRSDGKELCWRQVGFLAARSPEVPFVIEWGEGSLHPADDSPVGCTIARFTVACSNSTALRQLCTDLGAAAVITEAAIPWLELVLDTPRGEVKLTS